MTLTQFLEARIAEDERRAHEDSADAMVGWRWKHYPPEAYEKVQALTLEHSGRILAECATKRQIMEFHESWPVMVETPPKYETVGGINDIAFRASQQIAWMTTQEYRQRFGDEPPTTPILRALALPYADHPDYDESWRP